MLSMGLPSRQRTAMQIHLCLTIEYRGHDRGSKQGRHRCFHASQARADGNKQAWAKDPDGNRIELIQVAPDHNQALAVAALEGINP